MPLYHYSSHLGSAKKIFLIHLILYNTITIHPSQTKSIKLERKSILVSSLSLSDEGVKLGQKYKFKVKLRSNIRG